MADTEEVLKARLLWVQHFEQSKNAGVTCRRCGISRPTLRKWWRRYQQSGPEGLRSHSRRRYTPPPKKVTEEHQKIILSLRRQRRLGPKRIQSELKRTQQLSFPRRPFGRCSIRRK
jgi:transposase